LSPPPSTVCIPSHHTPHAAPQEVASIIGGDGNSWARLSVFGYDCTCVLGIGGNRIEAHTCMRTSSYTPNIRAHIHIHTRTRIHTHMHIHAQTRTDTHTYTHSHGRTRTQTHTYTNKRTRMHAQIQNTLTHTHTWQFKSELLIEAQSRPFCRVKGRRHILG